MRVGPLSRYKDTKVYYSDTKVYGLWEPVKFPESSEDITHSVRMNEIGFPDVIAVAYYGAGYEALGWSIMAANNIFDAETELYPGMRIRIPSRTTAMSYVAR